MSETADALSGLRHRVLGRVLGRLFDQLVALRDGAAKCGDRYRVGDMMAASETLIRLTDQLTQLSPTLTETTRAAGDATLAGRKM